MNDSMLLFELWDIICAVPGLSFDIKYRQNMLFFIHTKKVKIVQCCSTISKKDTLTELRHSK